MKNARKHFFRSTFDLTKDDYHDLLHGDTREYRGLYGSLVLERNFWLQWVTEGYKRLQGVTSG